MASGTRLASSRLADIAWTTFAFGLIARRAVELCEVVASRRWAARRAAAVAQSIPATELADRAHRLVCVVPLFDEKDIAVATVQFWRRLAADADLDAVLFVTTAKERAGAGPNTHELVAAELAEGGDERLRLVLCETDTRFRASQLNLGVEYGRATFWSKTRDETGIWLAVYNADSRPDRETFRELAYMIRAEPDTRVFQQLVDYVVPDRPGTGLVAEGNAMLQTWWTRSHYWARNRRGAQGPGAWSATSPYSTFGHGEFVRLDFVDDIGGFPDFAYADGLLLGWICRLRGEPIGLLASHDVAEVPRTAGDLLTQQTAWCRGLLNFDETVRWCQANGHSRLPPQQVSLLRARHAAIPVAWGLSSLAVGAGALFYLRRTLSGDATASDLAKLAALLSYPIVPALVAGAAAGPTARRVSAATTTWWIEGVGFWPASASHLRRDQKAPVKTPR